MREQRRGWQTFGRQLTGSPSLISSSFSRFGRVTFRSRQTPPNKSFLSRENHPPPSSSFSPRSTVKFGHSILHEYPPPRFFFPSFSLLFSSFSYNSICTVYARSSSFLETVSQLTNRNDRDKLVYFCRARFYRVKKRKRKDWWPVSFCSSRFGNEVKRGARESVH